MPALTASTNVAQMYAPKKPVQIRVTQRSPAYWRVAIDNPPINVMGPEMVKQFQEVIGALEADEQVRVVVFESAVDGYFLNHSDFTARLEDLTSMPEDAHLVRGRYGFFGVFAWRVEQCQDSKELPLPIVAASYAKRAKTSGSEVVDCLFHVGFDLARVVRQFEGHLGGPFGHSKLHFAVLFDCGFRPFVNRIEGEEMKDGKSIHLGRIFQST